MWAIYDTIRLLIDQGGVNMICKFCGTEIGETTSCPVCNDGKSISSNDGERLEQAQPPVNEAELEQIEEKPKENELAEEIYKKTNKLNFVGAFFNIVPMIMGFLIPMLLVLVDKIPRGVDRTGDIINISRTIVIGLLLGIFVKEIYNLVEKLLLRSMMKPHTPPLSVLMNKLIVNGKIKNAAWNCIRVHPDNDKSKYAFVESAAYIVVAVICGAFSYFYFSDISLRYETAEGLPSTGIAWFFVTPLAVLIVVLLVAYAVAKIVSQAKTTVIDTTKSN